MHGASYSVDKVSLWNSLVVLNKSCKYDDWIVFF